MNKPETCLPEGVTHGQFVDVIKKYLENNPVERPYDAANSFDRLL